MGIYSITVWSSLTILDNVVYTVTVLGISFYCSLILFQHFQLGVSRGSILRLLVPKLGLHRGKPDYVMTSFLLVPTAYLVYVQAIRLIPRHTLFYSFPTYRRPAVKIDEDSLPVVPWVLLFVLMPPAWTRARIAMEMHVPLCRCHTIA